jgi:hypothetical protein
MFRSQNNPPRSFQRFSAPDLAASRSSLATAPLTPFPATLRGKSHLIENPAALSRVVAALTRHVHHNPFVCHSYKKHPGARIPSECHPERGEGSSFSRSLSPLRRQSHPSKGNPAIVAALSLPLVTSHQSLVTASVLSLPLVTSHQSLVTASVLSLPPVTSHQSQITNSFIIRASEKHTRNPFGMNTSKTQDLNLFRMNTYKKTGRGGLPSVSTAQGIRRILCSFSFALPDNFCSSFKPPMPQLARNGRKHSSRDCSSLWGWRSDSRNS